MLRATLAIVSLICGLLTAAPLRAADVRCTLPDGGTLHDLRVALAVPCATVTTLPGAHVTLETALSTTDRVEVPASTQLVFGSGALWTLQARVEVTVRGAVSIALERRAFFNGPGRLIFPEPPPSSTRMDTCGRAASVAYPEWFGAVVNDAVDDARAVQLAADLARDVSLLPGSYVVGAHLWLLRGQALVGAGKSQTTLRVDANFALQKVTRDAQGREVSPSLDILFNDFVVGLDSDCSGVRDLTIDGSAFTAARLLAARASGLHSPYISLHGVQIATHHWWQTEHARRKEEARLLGVQYVYQMVRAIENVDVSRVDIVSPPVACILLQSSVAAHHVLIDKVTCKARDEFLQQAGLNLEVWHPDRAYANVYEDLVVQDSAFSGGRYATFRVAGVNGLVMKRSSIEAGPRTRYALSLYTGDASAALRARFYNVTVANRNPQPNLDAASPQAFGVVEIAARGLQNRADLPFLAVPEGGTVVEFYDSTILAPRFGQTTATIPLVVNAIGTSEPTLFSRVYFMGGTTAIFAPRNDVRMSGYFPTETPRFRPFSDEETRVAALNSSIHALLCTFDRQSDAAIITEFVELRVHDSNFKKIGMNPSRGQPIIQFGQPSTLGPQSGSLVADNGYSAVNATAFLSATGRSDGTIVVRNAPLPLQVGERSIPLLLPLDPSYDDTWRF